MSWEEDDELQFLRKLGWHDDIASTDAAPPTVLKGSRKLLAQAKQAGGIPQVLSSMGKTGGVVPLGEQRDANLRQAATVLGMAAKVALQGVVEKDLIDVVAAEQLEFLEGVREQRQLLRSQLRNSFVDWVTRVSAAAP